ncbi:hypothetical protein BABINDRAFT_166848 [Babjeviella inositovora NRRL Y-12698]|uniref:Uncharacterized protein n=1 Tax=Babjeviella inositovora NRRL Y-12698 TaxID=984486 RepID=A0A1E3QQ19_9ASCO|nr:uncharacterized protein BABINDRAFT_166848 [Babjeviella inositovora NRRL Y-12698]ODQ79738.1 hypothetical protein BABINDRAFT_166848 [Babjeviella inositovora NRRL Y-12698]
MNHLEMRLLLPEVQAISLVLDNAATSDLRQPKIITGSLSFRLRSQLKLSALSIRYKSSYLREIPVKNNPAIKQRFADSCFHVCSRDLATSSTLSAGFHTFPFSLDLHPELSSLMIIGEVLHKISVTMVKADSRFSAKFPLIYRRNITREMNKLMEGVRPSVHPIIPLKLNYNVMPPPGVTSSQDSSLARPETYQLRINLHETVTLYHTMSTGVMEASRASNLIAKSEVRVIAQYSFTLSDREVDDLRGSVFNKNLFVDLSSDGNSTLKTTMHPDFHVKNLLNVTHVLSGYVLEVASASNSTFQPTGLFRIPTTIKKIDMVNTRGLSRVPRYRWRSDTETLFSSNEELDVEQHLGPFGGTGLFVNLHYGSEEMFSDMVTLVA